MSNHQSRPPDMTVHFCEELDAEVCVALASMLATEPTQEEVAKAMIRLKATPPPASLEMQHHVVVHSPNTKTRRWLLATASLLVFVMCMVATTEAWAQVARDFSDPVYEPQPISTLANSTSVLADAKTDVGFTLRLVLMAHISLLMAGLIGMAITWLIAISDCFRVHWRNSWTHHDTSSTQRRILLYSLVLYTAGILLGCIWAQATWGRIWSWDARETFALITLAFVALWLRCLIAPNEQTGPDKTRSCSLTASTATIAFGAIAMMFVLGSRYASTLHSYGPPSMMLPTLVFGLFAACLLAIWISFGINFYSSRNAPQSHP